MKNKMKISQVGIDLIKEFEGFRTHPYRDSVGIWTVGYGTTHYMSGRHVTKNDQDINEITASHLLEDEVNKTYAHAVNVYVQVQLTQNQFDALVSFVYNLGTGSLKQSTLLRKLNSGDYVGATNEFHKWSHAGGHVIHGLAIRREREKEVFQGLA